jgi:hypothetical protein
LCNTQVRCGYPRCGERQVMAAEEKGREDGKGEEGERRREEEDGTRRRGEGDDC